MNLSLITLYEISYNFYTSNSGLTATDNTLILNNENGKYIDAISWSNNDGTWSATNQSLFQTLISTGHWVAGSVAQDECFVWTPTKTQSISRRYNDNRLPIDTNQKDDWQILDLTKGKENVVVLPPPSPAPTESNLKILINEVMPDNGDDDWIEFFVAEGSGTIKDFKLYQGNTLIKTFSDISVNTSDYFVLNFGKTDLTDDTTKGEKGYFDFYTSNSGLTATDNTLILNNENGKYIDAISWSNNDGTWSATNQSLFQTLISTGHWVAGSVAQDECFVWTPTSEKSISRKYSQESQPIDTNQKDDWEVARITKGKAKEVVIDDFQEDVDLKILNTHFSPYGDYKNKTIKVKYKNKKNVNLKIKIYDVNLHLILSLLDTNDSGVFEADWDGKNGFGDIMGVGVYVIYYEFVDKTKGLIKKGKKAVVLGKVL